MLHVYNDIVNTNIYERTRTNCFLCIGMTVQLRFDELWNK